MNDFIEKYKNDSRFKAGTQLSIYIIFIIIVVIFALSNQNNMNEKQEEIIKNNPIESTEDNIEPTIIELNENYKLKIEIDLDNEIILYDIEKTLDETKITKIAKGLKKEYILKDNNYYINNNDNYILSNEKEVYDSVDYNYINVDTINTYLKKSEKQDDKYVTYLNDLILNNNNDKYITIIINDNTINIDYTELMKESNIANEKCNIKIEIENKEE